MILLIKRELASLAHHQNIGELRCADRCSPTPMPEKLVVQLIQDSFAGFLRQRPHLLKLDASEREKYRNHGASRSALIGRGSSSLTCEYGRWRRNSIYIPARFQI